MNTDKAVYQDCLDTLISIIYNSGKGVPQISKLHFQFLLFFLSESST